MAKKLWLDELNILKQYIQENENITVEELLDMAEDTLIMAYLAGVNSANEDLNILTNANIDELKAALDMKFDGKGYRERLTEYCKEHDIASIDRVLDTDSHRLFNQGVIDIGRAHGARYKQWHTMEDWRVREEHWPLDRMTVPFEDKFVTWDGFETIAPGLFGVPELDINCRCYLTLS